MPDRPYEIRVRETKDGFDLTGPAIPFSLWFRSVREAVGYARWAGRDRHVAIRVYRANGELAKEGRFPPGDGLY